MRDFSDDLPIILMTGGGRPIGAQRLQAAGIREVVRKSLLSATIANPLHAICPPNEV